MPQRYEYFLKLRIKGDFFGIVKRKNMKLVRYGGGGGPEKSLGRGKIRSNVS